MHTKLKKRIIVYNKKLQKKSVFVDWENHLKGGQNSRKIFNTITQ